jgi:rRNA maturation protein Nop10
MIYTYPAETRCPKCGHYAVSTACRFCGVSKIK